jgi:alpha-tubulin suppressor-like RCC1 family protein
MAVQQLLMMGTQASGRTEISGELWTWGTGSSGALGDGTTTARFSVPAQVGSLTDWTNNIQGGFAVIAGASVYCVKTDGTLWVWGHNAAGKLGVGDTTNRSSPVQVGSDTDWKEAGNGSGGFVLAIKTDGTLWAWGNNYAGYLGQGDTTNRSSPVQIGSLTDWLHVIPAFGQNSYKAMAIKTDGTIWHWGVTSTSPTVSSSSPIQVGSDSDWSDIMQFGWSEHQSIYAIKEA